MRDTNITTNASLFCHRSFCRLLFAVLLAPGLARAQEVAHEVDVTVIRRVEQHPQAWRVWQPVMINQISRKAAKFLLSMSSSLASSRLCVKFPLLSP